jgi:SNF2 family DNA or RNA helicase
VENCGKMIVLDKLLDKLINKEKRKILIFSQFKIQLDILEDYCTMRDYNYLRLDGDTEVEQREEMMKIFN